MFFILLENENLQLCVKATDASISTAHISVFNLVILEY